MYHLFSDISAFSYVLYKAPDSIDTARILCVKLSERACPSLGRYDSGRYPIHKALPFFTFRSAKPGCRDQCRGYFPIQQIQCIHLPVVHQKEIIYHQVQCCSSAILGSRKLENFILYQACFVVTSSVTLRSTLFQRCQ